MGPVRTCKTTVTHLVLRAEDEVVCVPGTQVFNSLVKGVNAHT